MEAASDRAPIASGSCCGRSGSEVDDARGDAGGAGRVGAPADVHVHDDDDDIALLHDLVVEEATVSVPLRTLAFSSSSLEEGPSSSLRAARLPVLAPSIIRRVRMCARCALLMD